jgi:monofunctional biosynthetic peptidoglycan transglycosylase
MRKVAAIILLCAILWFIPWVFVLQLGMVAYFPYHPDGTRYVRVTGPIPNFFGASWISSKDIPKSCKAALVAAEDGHFYSHHGIDIKGVKAAWKKNQRSGKIHAGGSTITQQIVKNIFLSRDRSYVRKSRELIGALLLDLTMSKDHQLGWYLNVVEFGPDLYGIENAALYYFKTKPQNLNSNQCVALVGLLPDPKKSGPALKRNQLTNRMRTRYRHIVRTLSKSGTLSQNSLAGLKSYFEL